jgi:cytochrome d ubiquinol oxidase subunit I
VGFTYDAQGRMVLESLGALLTNPWLPWQYLHTMAGATVTGAFVMAAIGAFYILTDPADADETEGESRAAYGRIFLRTSVPVGLIASVLLAFPTGDQQAVNLVRYQPPSFAAMEGLFHSEQPAGLVLFGQPDMDALALDNPVKIPGMLSLLAYKRLDARVDGLTEFAEDEWPDNVPLLFYSYHLMIALGTLFIGVMALAAFLLWKGKLSRFRPALWLLMLSAPLPFVANSVGWMTAEVGRQPWLVWGILRTADGSSQTVQAGNALFSLIGFMGIYLILGILYLFLAQREIAHGPNPAQAHEEV